MRRRSTSLASLVVAAAAAVALPAAADEGGDAFARAVEAAHRADAFRAHAAFTSGVTVDFGGQRALEGTMTADTVVGRARLELANGAVVVFDGEEAWVSPADAEVRDPRFHVLTWPYFLAAPTKLRDPGANLEAAGERVFLDGVALPAARLTFDAGVGDAPDDWYLVHRDPETGRVAGMAYIVTFGGRDPAAAAAEAHAITYHDWVDVDGIPIPTRWQFWNWSEDQGVHGDPIGEVHLAGFRFLDPPADAFTAPAEARHVPLPGS